MAKAPLNTDAVATADPDAANPVSGSTPAAADVPDPHHGMGGLYEMRNGQRVLIERTADTDLSS